MLQARDNIDNPYKIPTIEDLLSDLERENDKSTEPERVENVQFHEDVDQDEDVDAILDSFIEDLP